MKSKCLGTIKEGGERDFHGRTKLYFSLFLFVCFYLFFGSFQNSLLYWLSFFIFFFFFAQG